MSAPSGAITAALDRLSATSFVAHREVLDSMPALSHHGEAVLLRWLEVARRLFEHDRDAGKAFIRGSREAEKISETVLPWTEQALSFVQWQGCAPALEVLKSNPPRVQNATLSSRFRCNGGAEAGIARAKDS